MIEVQAAQHFAQSGPSNEDKLFQVQTNPKHANRRRLVSSKTIQPYSKIHPSAGEFLKADTISYAAKKEELDPYFTSLAGKWGWDTVYLPSAEEKATSATNNTLLFAISSLLIIAPLAWVYFVYIQC
jgi:NADPH-dependent 2,4-dienoyl-CoA reductase/sulfur reductase-like enzyme